MRWYYMVQTKTVHRKYQVSEFRWDSTAQILSEPRLFQMTAKQTHDWFGITPNQGDGLRKEMWVYIPRILRRDLRSTSSLLEEYLQDPDVIAPYSIKTLRYFPPVDLSLSEQGRGAPSRFKIEAT